MAAKKSVIVLIPSYRRRTVHVTPNTTILQILEEVCLKEQLQPEEYDLKHHRAVLDTTTTLQFSGLPNNALLEMVPIQRVRVETSVTLCLQLESGNRLTGTFLPSDTLWTVVTKLCPEEEDNSAIGANPVVIYMRQEISGVEALKGVTLRHLGLTGSRAMLRFVHRTPDELRTQANVSAPLKRIQATPKETIKDKQEKPLDSMHTAETASCDMLAEKTTVLQEQKPFPVIQGLEADKMELDQEAGVGTDGIESHSRVSEVVMENHVNGNSDVCESDNATPDDGSSKLILLGERNAVVFLLDSAPEVQREELSDSYFDLTVEDARIIYNDLKNKRAELEEAPLSTSAMRELEKSKQVLNNLHNYRKVVLRIQFPDLAVLQGMFSPVETVGKVMEFVRQYLEHQDISFYLFTTPPKKILEPELTLVEAECVPRALLHFGCDTGDIEFFIRPDILSKSSSFSAAMAAAHHSRRKASDSCTVASSALCEKRPQSPQPSTSSQNDDVTMTQDYRARVSHNKETKKVPKWFKVGK